MSKFATKNKIDNTLYGLFNIASDVYFHLNLDVKKLLSKNEAFRDVHKGERCFILGTGPSLGNLNGKQVRLLKNEVVFAVNSIYKSEVVSEITPKYYCLIDNNYWNVTSYAFEEIYNRYSQAPPTFITDVRATPFIPESSERILLHPKHYPINNIRVDLTSNLSITMNVVSSSILAALYMGFKEIYLLGCDYNSFCSSNHGHCYDDSKEITELPQYNLSFYLKYYHLTTEFHYLIARHAVDNDVKIMNLCADSLLDAYPRALPEAVL